ncbi:TPA: RHS repeat-associated core domain-containing protein [Serratia rubidaea]|nr:RHS repeat-associated core domain-containing protein [Serratia rubidaea]HDJ1464207.1 RHS repeat-associated core domain-containing protein [Serratia rubidaea]
MLTDVQGGLVWSEQCGVWGEPGVVHAEQVANPLRFQGQYFDAETGLHYNRYRYYDPQTGSYISQDPIGLEGGINLYAYSPNPLGWIDPLGLSCSPTFNPQKKFKYKEGEMSVMKHILSGHAKDALQESTSKFLTKSPKKITKYINEALEKGTLSSNGKELIYKFSRDIGTNLDGKTTKTIKLFIDSKGWVRTAFPL